MIEYIILSIIGLILVYFFAREVFLYWNIMSPKRRLQLVGLAIAQVFYLLAGYMVIDRAFEPELWLYEPGWPQVVAAIYIGVMLAAFPMFLLYALNDKVKIENRGQL